MQMHTIEKPIAVAIVNYICGRTTPNVSVIFFILKITEKYENGFCSINLLIYGLGSCMQFNLDIKKTLLSFVPHIDIKEPIQLLFDTTLGYHFIP